MRLGATVGAAVLALNLMQPVAAGAQSEEPAREAGATAGSPGSDKEALRTVEQTLKLLADAGFDTQGSFERMRSRDGRVEAWRLVAYRDLSNERHQWCGWLSSCQNQRLYESAADAERGAQALVKLGYVTDVAPLAFVPRARGLTGLSPAMLAWRDADLVYTVSEEVARQAMRGPDAPFVHSYAATVAKAVLMRWAAALPAAQRLEVMQREVDRAALVRDLRELEMQLRSLSEGVISPSGRRVRQDELLALVRTRVEGAGPEVAGGRLGLARLAGPGLTRASLDALPPPAPYVDALDGLLQEAGGDLRAFNRAVADLARKPQAERMAVLQASKLARTN